MPSEDDQLILPENNKTPSTVLEENSETTTETKGTDEDFNSNNDLDIAKNFPVFNGYGILQGDEEQIDCQFGPNSSGKFITFQVSLIEYEIMCRQTEDAEFCNCETTGLEVINDRATESVYNELYTA